MGDDGEVVDLGLRRALEAGPAVELTVKVFVTPDGRLVSDWECYGWSDLDDSWVREQLRWAMLCTAKDWRMGLRRRKKGER